MTTNHKTNRLAKEKSPYLLQHAHNPVNWYPWSDEAFESARRENKPIFLSIGYSTCHWCHVMERESFEDEEVAELLNEHYVAIKVDREERPDIDHIYMSICQALTGQGGWPLTIVMTPEQKAFYAGTYFPKNSRHGRPGLMDVLSQLADKWESERDRLVDASESILEQMAPRFSMTTSGDADPQMLERAARQFAERFDALYGGFGSAPKFPSPHNLLFLLRYGAIKNHPDSIAMVEKTLVSMAKGGIYDHIGFGFARYSVDRKWLVPHFEKMLYDNALLASAYLEAYQITGKDKYARTAEEIFTYVLREMTDADGGFYSAEDADSEGEEGKFYVWSVPEIKEVLGEELGELYCSFYDITPKGNFEGVNIPNLIHTDLDDFCSEHALSPDQWLAQVKKANEQLFARREERVHPYKDDKILTAWNSLMIVALAKGARVLDRAEYRQAAERAAAFVMQKLTREDGRLLARYRDGHAAHLGYLDDYAFWVWALLELYEATFDESYLKLAINRNQAMIDLFWDQERGGFYFYGADAQALIARPKELYDGAIPSGNSVAALNLLRLAKLTGAPDLAELAERQIQTFAGEVAEYPTGYSFFLLALQFWLGPTQEIVIAGDPTHADTEQMIALVRQQYMPQAVVLFHPDNERAAVVEQLAAYSKGQNAVFGKAAVYICENFACRSPQTDLQAVLASLQRR